MKLLFLIGDGMGDWPLEELDNKTPLEAAQTPAMDMLSRQGKLGLCRTIPPGMEPGSDVANMSLMGYDPTALHTGRGPIEAAAQGIEPGSDDLIYRCNLVSVTELTPEGVMLDYSAGHIDNAAARDLVGRLKKELDDTFFTFHPGFQYRHLLVQKNGAREAEADMNIRPPHDITDQPMGPDLAKYMSRPRIWKLMEKAGEILRSPENKTEANAIWLWGQGRSLLLPGFEETFGLKGGVISAVDLVKGLGRAAHMTVPDIPGATGLLDTNYEGKVEAALELLRDHDFLYLHVEAPDECGHEGSIEKKVEAITRFDKRIVAPLVDRLGTKNATFLVTCDHFTPIAQRTHTTDPVPFILAGPNTPPDTASVEFNEKNAKKSELFLDQGHELIKFALTLVPR